MSRYIDADKLVDLVDELVDEEDYIEDIKYLIDKTPTEDVKPIVSGEWKWDGEYICSVCGGISRRMSYNFCPFCGADMRKESEEEE